MDSDMLQHIKNNKVDIWNKRFENRMKEMNLKQREFAKLYKDRFGTGSQSDVCKWMNIGVKKRNGGRRKFPEFETMNNIAEILGVSVGYLIGETDFETFELERASKYIGLSSKAVAAIRAITSGNAIGPFFKYSDPQINSALELLLSNSVLVEYLKNMYGVAEAMNREPVVSEHFNRAINMIPLQYRDIVMKLWEDEYEAIENGIVPTEELLKYVSALHQAATEDMEQADLKDKQIKAAKYALQETHIKMMSELFSEDHVQRLLPDYTKSK